MKLLLLTFLCAGLFCCESTDDDLPVFYDYNVINKSGVSITIIPYKDNPVLNQKVSLSNDEVFHREKIDVAPYNGYSLIQALFGEQRFNYTHVLIVFDNQKKIIYESCDINMNCNLPLRNIFSYEFMDSKETYTITADDYANAVNCNGNCY